MKVDKQTQKLHDATTIIARQKAISDALFQSIGEGAIATDEDGKISRVNRVALDLLGFQRQDLVGKWFPSTIIASDEKGKVIPTIDRPITRSFISGKTIAAQCYYRKKDGSLLPVAVTVAPVILGGRPVGAIGVFRDITEELEIDRMKSEFISLASHQLRTPATAVKTYVALLKEGFGGKLNEKQQQFAELAYSSNERQLQIVNDLLFIARTESRSLVLKKERVNLNALAKEVVGQQISTIRKRNQTLHLELPENGVFHEVDPSFFKMVFDNLLSNASKYTPEGGKLTLKLSRRKGRIELAVSDTGVGIESVDIGRLFQKFTRIDNPLSSRVGGSGIGLYLLKQIVDLHDGRIDVESEKGKGTTFTVKLPTD
jgi:PAS domain S-box-containing protein